MVSGCESSSQTLRDSGFTIFVNFVSKRIHVSFLKQVFQVYGVVLDVFIAYKSLKRKFVDSTFAFVRFKTRLEASLAVKRADGMVLDGFKIRDFHEYLSDSRSKKVEEICSRNKVWKPAVKGARLSKEVVGGALAEDGLSVQNIVGQKVGIHSGPDAAVHVRVADECEASSSYFPSVENRNVLISKSELSWRESCLVGKVKHSLNETVIKSTFKAEGLNVKVSCWQDRLLIIQFKNVIDCQACWVKRDVWIRSWFDELDLLEGYDNRLKFKVWVSLKDVPPSIWSVKLFNAIGCLWGRVIKVDEDTARRVRFDVARVLLEVHSISSIPDKLSIVVEGRFFSIIVQSVVQEEAKVLLDGTKVEDGEWCAEVEEGSNFSAFEVVGAPRGSNVGGVVAQEHGQLVCQRCEENNVFLDVGGQSVVDNVDRAGLHVVPFSSVNELTEEHVIIDKVKDFMDEGGQHAADFVGCSCEQHVIDDSAVLININRELELTWESQPFLTSTRIFDVAFDEVSSLFVLDEKHPIANCVLSTGSSLKRPIIPSSSSVARVSKVRRRWACGVSLRASSRLIFGKRKISDRRSRDGRPNVSSRRNLVGGRDEVDYEEVRGVYDEAELALAAAAALEWNLQG